MGWIHESLKELSLICRSHAQHVDLQNDSWGGVEIGWNWVAFLGLPGLCNWDNIVAKQIK